jgi:hypothetical protein
MQMFSQKAADRDKTLPAGRLDSVLGRRLGETLRELFSLKYQHSSPGGEWPVESSGVAFSEHAFWKLAQSLDCAVDTANNSAPAHSSAQVSSPEKFSNTNFADT